MILRADFHLHSCLSPCGDLTMSPRTIASILARRGIRIAALTDHNSALNCPAFALACAAAGVVPLFGIEAQTREECHVLCLFADTGSALELGEDLYARMPPVMNVPEKNGDQVWVNENDEIEGEVDKFLVVSADISLEELSSRVVDAGGLVIPAHVDRPYFSLTSQLGFIPDGPWSALEVTRMPASIDTRGYPLITSSDAHFPEHVGRRAFDLDIADAPLLDAGGRVSMETIKAALSRRPRS
jgi:PHP family Zn ribbon phosphoesterase